MKDGVSIMELKLEQLTLRHVICLEPESPIVILKHFPEIANSILLNTVKQKLGTNIRLMVFLEN